MYLHEAFARALQSAGVENLFGVVGDGNLYVADSFVRAGGSYAASVHEAGAILMAHGYAQATGRIGVATTTHGPGLTNTITPLADAVMGHVPLLLVVGDTARADIKSLQDVDQYSYIAPTGAGFETIRSPELALEQLGSVLARIVAERRPYVVNVPSEFWWDEAEFEPVKLPSVWRRPRPAVEAVEEATGLVGSSRRPLILAGRGTTSPEARKAVERLSARLNAPIATTLKAKDAFGGHENAVGLFGGLSSSWTLDVIGESDCIIALGAGLNRRTTVNGSLFDQKRVIQVDDDARQVGITRGVSLSIHADVAETIDAVISLLDEAEIEPSSFFDTARRQRFLDAAGPIVPVASTEDPDAPITMGVALQWVDGIEKEQRTVAFDGGRFMYSALHEITTEGSTGWIEAMNFASIGLGVGIAVGAGIARPDRPVLLVTGDGGFMLGGLAEFTSAVRAKVDLIVVVLNDSAYGAEHIRLVEREMDTSISEFEWPDLGPVAQALGGAGMTLRTVGDFAEAERLVRDRSTPILLDIKLDPALVPMP